MPRLPITTGLTMGSKILKFVRFAFLIVFFSYIFISAIVIGIQERDAGIIVKELGEELINPLQSAQEISIKISLEGGGFLEYYNLLFSLMTLYLWLKIIQIFIVDLFFAPKETSGKLKRWSMSIFFFLLILVFYSLIYLNKGINYPLEAIWDILKGFQHIFTGFDFKEGTESFLATSNDCVEGVCVE